MRLIKIKSAVAMLVAVSLTGCAVSQFDVNHAYDAANADASRAMANVPESMALVEDVPTAFLGDRLVPVAYEATLPAIFREKSVTFPGNLPVSKIATLVSSATGYPVHLSPDVFIPRDALIPKTNGGGVSVPMQSAALAKTNVEPVYAQPCSCKVGEYLRGVTENLGLDWTFDGTTISISRFVTKTFTIAAIPGKVSIKSTLSKGTDTSTGNQSSGGTMGGTSGNTGSFSSITSSGRDGTFDQIAIIQSELEKLKSPLGEVVVNPQSRLVMVRDTKEAVDRMGALLARENAISTRQVALRVRTLQVDMSNGTQAGVSADFVFNRISDGLKRYAVAFASPTSLATAAGGTVGLSVLKPGSPLEGTNAIISGLNSFGKTVQDNTQTKLTLNGLPVSIGSFETKGYLASTSPSVGSLTGGTSGVPGLQPGSVTVGDFVNILPSVNDHNQIILSYWSDSSKLNGPFTTISTGSGDTLQQIQLPDILGSKDDQTIALSDGQTVVLYGALTNHYDGTSNNGIGGLSGAWNKGRTFQVIMLTATVVPSI
ncbi:MULTISPECIES: type II secretory pathway protein [unclassified Caballeronia]|uniref:type II secretory pathway protein n=1 Tax=unclassified Caballeronia TaxID=2646786 RepID=UPI002859767C|nr:MULTISPECIES: type II secretory pathway protein [unclassified Caballeronia]MDR5776872.1 type II secretory pathway protein [Caballeronia sp. LZ002]MDR5798822.1 type II secretory pathway protein [Caballeronia sp. LZ001]MDR5852343.1 type II secretory pathway protein [Caballeronia sp. LZ003]